MNKEQQLIEIAKDLCSQYAMCTCTERDGHCITPYLHARIIYNLGYRKQQECENISKEHPVDEFICSNCGFITRDCHRYKIDAEANPLDESCYEFEFKYCPRCGAKVVEK